ncbi:MAG: hypothetical protein QOE32_7805 [Pseudonocardiales bacterium]|nr:hypothetical protein [Pseudonocardiales bacterium]
MSEKQLAADRVDRDRLNGAAGVIRARAREAYYKIGVFPDHAYPFATLLNVVALQVSDVPPGVRVEALVVVAAVDKGLATPDTLSGESC